MKKIWIGLAVFSIVALSFGAASYAYAQGGSNPWGGSHNPGMMGSGYSSEMMGDYDYSGYGMLNGGEDFHMMGDEDGPMHEAMIAAFADALGLTPEELETRHDDGETLWEIAEALGLSESEIQALTVSARGEAMIQAVGDGQFDQEQADWMLSHMGEGTFGSGDCDGSAGGFHGHGMNWDASTGARP